MPFHYYILIKCLISPINTIYFSLLIILYDLNIIEILVEYITIAIKITAIMPNKIDNITGKLLI